MAQMCKCVTVCCIVLLYIKEVSMLEAQLCKCAAVCCSELLYLEEVRMVEARLPARTYKPVL